MQKKTDEFLTNKVSPKLLDEIRKTLEGLDYGSVELYVTDGEVTQITQRKIRKTKGLVEEGIV